MSLLLQRSEFQDRDSPPGGAPPGPGGALKRAGQGSGRCGVGYRAGAVPAACLVVWLCTPYE